MVPGLRELQYLKTFKEAAVELGMEPHQFTIVSGIGQAAKFPHYLNAIPSMVFMEGAFRLLPG